MSLGVQFTNMGFQALDNNGDPIPYGKVYFKDSFTGQPILSYKNSGLTVVNTDPVILSASGKADIYLAANQYDIVITDQNDQVIKTVEDFITVGLGVDLSAWREKQVATTVSQTDFTFNNALEEGVTFFFKNGVLMEEGATADYTITPPYTLHLNIGVAVDTKIEAFGRAPTVTKSSLYADGSVEMDAGYTPATPKDICTLEAAEAAAAAAAAAYFPIGSIIMWKGTAANIPTGWQKCDGTNGTPNLSNKFIYGAVVDAEVGTTGGSADAVAVAHTHTASTDVSGEHTHNVDLYDAVTSGEAATISCGGGGAAFYTNRTLVKIGGNHSHTLTVDSAGVSGVGKNLPPYTKLYFIMKIA